MKKQNDLSVNPEPDRENTLDAFWQQQLSEASLEQQIELDILGGTLDYPAAVINYDAGTYLDLTLSASITISGYLLKVQMNLLPEYYDRRIVRGVVYEREREIWKRDNQRVTVVTEDGESLWVPHLRNGIEDGYTSKLKPVSKGVVLEHCRNLVSQFNLWAGERKLLAAFYRRRLRSLLSKTRGELEAMQLLSDKCVERINLVRQVLGAEDIVTEFNAYRVEFSTGLVEYSCQDIKKVFRA